MDRALLAQREPPAPAALRVRPEAHADEQAADVAAARILAGSTSPHRHPTPEPASGPGARAPALAVDVAREPGVALEAGFRSEFAGRFTFDLATVRVHADARAARAADSVHALAYTVGRDIVFAADEYAPGTQAGQLLLLHELVHVAQQGCATAAAVYLHRKGKTDAPEGSKLQRALDSKDDDPVRDLVASDEWKTTILEPWQAAWLIIYLLIGFTGDDDEQAGLKILENVGTNHRFDLTLNALRQEDRWEQLFDDYHGDEYGQLLHRLALGIETEELRGAFLDKFIDEWFVDIREEQAIVDLLTKAPDAELPALLDQKKRETELRDAIDNTEPRRGFERRVGRKNELNFDAGTKRATTAIVEEVNQSPLNRRRSAAEIAGILADAPKDLAAEAKGYKDRLKIELAKPDPDWDVVSKLHHQFTVALDTIEARKRSEVEMELKYNLKFNYWERPADEKEAGKWGEPWTSADLAELDKVLAALPPDILASTTELRTFARATDQPWLSGQANETRVSLFGPEGLIPSSVVHELGHTVAFTDGRKMQAAWDAHFKWMPRDAKGVPADVKKKLDAFTADELKTKDARVKDGDWYYRKNRYAGGYLRHPADMCFVSDYAATAASDDFAETFMKYVLHGKELKEQCPAKYEFMHAEVFVKFFLEKQGERALRQFSADYKVRRDQTPMSVRSATKVDGTFVRPLRKEVADALTAEVAAKHKEAEAGRLANRPLKGDEATTTLAPFTRKLNALFDLLGPLVSADQTFQAAWDAHPFKIKKSQTAALQQLSTTLKERLLHELAAQWTPLATRVIAGDKVDPAAITGADALVARYVAAIPRVGSVIGEYAKNVNVTMNPFEPDAAVEAASKREEALVDKILDPKSKPAPKVHRQPAADTDDEFSERAEPPTRPEPLVPTGGRPLRPDVRGAMESQIGRDFGDVRVHDDAAAAESADALQANAYTVGPDIMFAQGKHGVDTAEGRELLGHELAHVAQQGGAPTAAGPSDQAERVPTVLEEPVTLPDTVPAEPAEPVEDAAVPPAPTAPGTERETAAPAPTIALQRAAGASSLDAAGVVPADHPTERQAAAIGRQAAGLDGGRHNLIESPVGGAIHREPATTTAPKQRTDIVFFMGHQDKKGNPFYANARAYFKANVKTDLTVDKDQYRSLAGVFSYLRTLDPATPVGNIYLVSHANEDGTLSFGIDAGDKDAHTSYGELKAAVKDRPELFALPFGLIDRHSVIHIKGCNIGRSSDMLNKLDEAFGGGRGLVTAPTHKQVYGTHTEAGKTSTYEALSHYYLEYTGPVTKTRAEQLAEFKAKYAHIPEARWAALLPKAGTKRDVVAFKFSYTNAADLDEALGKARAYGQENFTRPEMYVWRVAGSKKVKGGLNVQLVAEKTNYTIDRLLEDDQRKRLVPDESDPLYFGKSTFNQVPTSPAQLQLEPARMTTAAVMGRIAEIDAELATPQPLEDEGRKKEAEYERGVMRDELGRRQVAVDVKVVKTEDWFGADEVYVTASGGTVPFTTKVHKLNDGQEHTYTVPLLNFLPLTAPIRFEVYDEDWPDRDDLIVRLDWRPPFAPLHNTESLDNADYRVQVRFER